MAVITVSKIQVRSGLYEDLPALDTGEFGWCVDVQRLFIGKGTLAEGAPETGVTEILTEYSIGSINVSIDSVNSNIANLNAILSNVLPAVSNLSPVTYQILNDQSNIINIANITVANVTSQIINYNITRDNAVRIGTINVTNFAGLSVAFEDSYTETPESTGVTLYFTGNLDGTAVLGYTSTNAGMNANLTTIYTNLQTIT